MTSPSIFIRLTVTWSLIALCLISSSTFADLSGYRIGIDPGHGGTDPGAMGPTGLRECDINLDTALAARDFMESANALVFMTRTTDVSVSLAARVDYLNYNSVDRNISVHHNASADPSPNYTGVHVYPGTCWGVSGNLASAIVQRLNTHMGIGFVSSNCSRQGVHEDNFYVLRETVEPAALTENSFISNPSEETRLYNPIYLDDNGWAIFAGLCDHLGEEALTPTPTPTQTPSGSGYIVDNVDSGFTVTSDTWLTSSYGSNYGINKRYSSSGTGSGSAVWTISLPSGQYNVSAWVNNATYTTNATYTIQHAAGSTVVTRSQYSQAGGWCIDLGNYTFNGSSSVTISDNAANGFVVADAIRWILTSVPTYTPTTTPSSTPTPSPTRTATVTPSPTQSPAGYWSLIIDNVDPGCTTSGGSWISSTYGTNYGTDKLVSLSGTGSGSATYASSFAQGQYHLNAWVCNANYSSNVQYIIHHAGGTAFINRSQNYTGGDWAIDLGIYAFDGFGSVVVVDDASSGYVVADAIRWEMISGNTPTPPPANTSTPTASPTVTGGPEFRGVWVTRWDYNDAADIAQIMSNIASANCNAVLFQVRGRADAFYDSDYEPWASELTGTLGADPQWDPLATAITQAHNLGLELHAYVNVYTCWSGSTAPITTSPQHIYNAHPDWLQCDESGDPMELNSGYVFVSPGIPAVKTHLMNVFRDIITKYDIDGIHFDYIRYAGQEYSHDPVSEARFVTDNPDGLTWSEWQCEQINVFISETYADLTNLRPGLKVTAAVWGIYKDYWEWGTSEGYYDYYQDSQKWVQSEILDAICPMIYWPLYDGTPPYFDYLINDFVDNAGNRHVYAGMSGDYDNFSEIANEITYSRSAGAQGYVIFAYSTLNANGYWDDLASGPNVNPVEPAPMPWKANTPTPVPLPALNRVGLSFLLLILPCLIFGLSMRR